MSEFLRTLVGRLREYAGDRRAPRRRVRLPVSLSLHERGEKANGGRPLPALSGFTKDLSATGLALIVPAIRIGGHYLAGGERTLEVELELPSGPIHLRVTSVRYEPVDEDRLEEGYKIGVRITDMSAADRECLKSYLK
ncbi:MAG: PilZ domain-containing protein [Acidobacteriota bacterium]|nr:PilZ domain-containing protein [Acidobacteriota bacterium]